MLIPLRLIDEHHHGRGLRLLLNSDRAYPSGARVQAHSFPTFALGMGMATPGCELINKETIAYAYLFSGKISLPLKMAFPSYFVKT